MAEIDPRSLSYTPEEQDLGSAYNPYGTLQPAPKPPKPPEPLQVQAEVGQDWEILADKLGIETDGLIKANPLDTEVKAGAVYNVPQFGGLTEEEQFWQDNLGVGGSYVDFLTHQETLDVTGVNKFGGQTSAPFETEFGDIVSPEGFNFQEFRMFGENTEGTGFWEDYNNLDVSQQNIFGQNAPTYGGISQEVDPRFQSYTPNELEAMGIDPAISRMIETRNHLLS